MNCTIITIGDELLIGQTIDTNSAWIGQEFNKLGIRILQRLAIGDDEEQIKNALTTVAAVSSLIILTGGLGPTKDDITKKTIAAYFGVGFTFYDEVWQKMVAIFEKRGKDVLEMNCSQAMLPANATMLPNKRGTAQGMWFDENGIVYVSLPGVPHEMKHLMETHVIPRLKERFELSRIIHSTVMTAGGGESTIASLLSTFEASLPPYMKLAYLPELGVVKLRLSAYGEATEEEVAQKTRELESIIPQYVYAGTEIKLEEFIGNKLKERKETLALAESCTGGYVAHLITSIAGSSDFFHGGVVSYSYDMKMEILGVQHETLTLYGAVSEQCVTEMVQGIIKHSKATYGIAISGIAGPGGATPDKPVGTVYIAVADKTNVEVKRFEFFSSRAENIKVFANAALNMLRLFVEKKVD
jgi:nicotinamide-nucleotide amidase